MCHDEPRDSAKGVKHDQGNITLNSGAAVKQEDSLPYLLGPSIDEQQLDQQALQDTGADLTTRAAVPDSQTDSPQFLPPQSSDPIAQDQGRIFGDKEQQCERTPSPSIL